MAGRPTDYTPEKADEICALLLDGMTIKKICALDHMPSIQTFFRWLRAHEEFRELYARAKDEQSDAMGEELIDIADDATPEDVQKARLRIDTRKWLMSKFKPKKYGDLQKHEIAGKDGGNLTIEIVKFTDTDEDTAAE